MSGSASGHIIVRRQAKDGKDGQDGAKGAKPRYGIYAAGKAYTSGAAGEEYFDVVYHTEYQQFFTCISSYPSTETHSPSLSTSNGYWEYNPYLESFFVDMLLANSAFIAQLAANSAFIKKLFAESIEASSMTLLEGCKVGGVQVTEKGIKVDIADTDGYVQLSEEGGFYASFGGRIAAVGGCTGASIQAYAGTVPLFCPIEDLKVALMASSEDGGYAAYFPSGVVAGFRPKIVNANSATAYIGSGIPNEASIIVAGYTAGSQYIYLPEDPPIGAWYRIINDYRRGSKSLTVYTQGKTIEYASGTGTSGVATTKRIVWDFYYDGTEWHCTE